MNVTEHLERARRLARRKGHGRVTSVHVLLSLSNRADVQRQMVAWGISLARLDRRVRDALANEPDARAYRDAPEPMLDASLEPVLANVVTEMGLFEALISPLMLALRFDDSPVRRFAEEVHQATLASGHQRALVEHALYALARRVADDGRFATALERLGYPRRDFRHHMSERIGVVTRSAPVASFEELVRRSVEHANATMREELGVEVLVVDLLRNLSTRAALEAVGIPHPAVLYSYVHGTVLPSVPYIGGAADVMFYPDDYTPRETLTDLLVNRFGQPPESAAALIQALREEGPQALRVQGGRAASDAVSSSLADCAEQGLPLRIELREPLT